MSSTMYNVPPGETVKTQHSHINGSNEELFARMKIQELCKGWPVYRDFSEWENYRSLFTKDATVFTTWSGGLSIEDFIAISIKGRANGDFIAHRENGTLAEVNLAKGRGLGKMKATITQRFTLDGIPVDIDCDCRFFFFVTLTDEGWKTRWVKLVYEKDKVVPIDGKTLPNFPKEALDKYTEGYKYLGYAQHSLGHKILDDLPNCNNQGFFNMYDATDKWLAGEDPDVTKV